MPANEVATVNSIFQQPWWLDAVAPGQWNEIILKRGEMVAARMPYVVRKKYGFTGIVMPMLTQTLGPWLRPSTARYHNQMAEQKAFLNDFISQLPSVDFFSQSFSPQITNWLPFYWAGYQQTTRYTYRIEDLQDQDKIWGHFAKNLRNSVRKAEKLVVVRDDLGLDEFLRLNDLTFARQNRTAPYTHEYVRRLYDACVKHNTCKLFFAEDAQKRVHAAHFVVWDSNCLYALMGGEDPELRMSEANSLVFWEIIKFTSTVSQIFDFEGSMIEPIEHYFRSFGAVQTPYFHITKMSRRMRIAHHGKELTRALFKG